MKRIAATILALSLGSGVILGSVTAQAQSAPVANPGAMPVGQTSAPTSGANDQRAIDPQMQRLFMTLATSVLANFAASAARGSLDGFDPGPTIESAFKSALNSRDIHGAIERMFEQAGTGMEGTATSPEMRALLKAALSGVVALARSEIAREFAVPSTSGATATP